MHPLLKTQFALRLTQIERDTAQTNATIEAVVAADQDLAARAEILTSIPGIAPSRVFSKPEKTTDNRIFSTDRHTRIGTSEWKTSCRFGWSCTYLAPIGKMAWQGTDSG